MPNIAEIGPYRFFFYSNEGIEPPHVHIRRERATAKFWLDPVALSSASGFPAQELRRLEALVTENKKRFQEVWHAYFSR
jgi:hypothetical protein